ncbi:MAG TPA: hypothetical protein PK294_09780 [Ignavibacteria bacterium]|nr:hypothetical protein [Ignavibacteria bacterium]HQY53343.1 hypothetical protein [Ignavibacteria bacterium]HRB00712.1 hypothetical protein [Ignavibacteria bacterium]
MKTNRNVQFFITLIAIFYISNIALSQEWVTNNYGNSGHSLDFLNANTGFIGLTVYDNGYKYKILKTTNKGVSFTPIWSTSSNQYNQQSFAFDMINEYVGYVYI